MVWLNSKKSGSECTKNGRFKGICAVLIFIRKTPAKVVSNNE